MDKTQFDSEDYDPGIVSSNRRYKRLSSTSGVNNLTHKIWAFPPHCGAQLVLPELCAGHSLAGGRTGVFLLAELDEWRKNGGHLLLNLGDVNVVNNATVTGAILACDSLTWVCETNIRRWEEVCLMELAAGKCSAELIAGEPLNVSALDYVHMACLHVWSWRQIFAIWQSLFRADRSVVVSEIWADSAWPWPHEIVWDFETPPIHQRGHRGIRALISDVENRNSLQFNTRELGQYFQHLPLWVRPQNEN